MFDFHDGKQSTANIDCELCVCVPWPKALDWARQSSNQADFFTITHTLPSQTKVHVELPNCHRQSLHHPK